MESATQKMMISKIWKIFLRKFLKEKSPPPKSEMIFWSN
jgi:hypothetical protein